jgi:23S rRNA (pseudouridine1915-N3)-methyltransferase
LNFFYPYRAQARLVRRIFEQPARGLIFQQAVILRHVTKKSLGASQYRGIFIWKHMYRLKIISVGRIKKGYWAEAVAHYEKMLRSTVRIEAVSVRDCSHLTGDERRKVESDRLLEKIGPRDTPIALHETGVLYTSVEFAEFLRTHLEDPGGDCCLLVGGALGFSAELLSRVQIKLSLSPLTMPHELALTVLYEQIFRAVTIWSGRTYHY